MDPMKEVTMSNEAPKKEFWAIVSLMGHQQIAGYLEEEQIAGHGMIKITVPELDHSRPKFCRFIEPKAVYSIDPVSEEVATGRARQIDYKPIDSWDINHIVEDIVKKAEPSVLARMNPTLLTWQSQTKEIGSDNEKPIELEEGEWYQNEAGGVAEVVEIDQSVKLATCMHYDSNRLAEAQIIHNLDGTVNDPNEHNNGYRLIRKTE